MRNPVDVGLSPSLAERRAGLQALLGEGYVVAAGVAAPDGVMLVDPRADVVALRARRADLRIAVVFGGADDPAPVEVIERIEAGADICLVDPSPAGLAAHVRALAAHRPELEVHARAV